MPQQRREVTPLSPQDERQFQQWVQQNKNAPGIRGWESAPYDMRGFFADKTALSQWKPGDHFPDTYKQHGHPTFSIESKYSSGPGDGGSWQGETFIPPSAKGNSVPQQQQQSKPWEQFQFLPAPVAAPPQQQRQPNGGAKPWEQFKSVPGANEMPSFWDSTMGRILGPSAEQWNPVNMAKGVGGLAKIVASDKDVQHDMSLGPLGMPYTPTGARAGKALLEGFVDPIKTGYADFQKGDYAGTMGQGLKFASQFVVPEIANPVVKAILSKTGVTKLPGVLAEAGINPSASLQKNFPTTEFGQTAVREGVATRGQASNVARGVDAALKKEIPTLPGTVDPLDNAYAIMDRVKDAGRFEGRGAFKVESENALSNAKNTGLADRYTDRWGPNHQLNAEDLYNEKLGQGDLANWGRDRLGATTGTNVDELWMQGNALENKAQLENMAQNAGKPSVVDQLKRQQDLLGIQNAFAAHKGPGHYLGSLTHRVLFNPNVLTGSAITIDRLARAILSKPGMFTAGQFGVQGGQ